MRQPIPGDWDGVSWQCIKVWFPESTYWLAIARGIIYELTRAKTWDERTGSVPDVQKLAWEIYRRAVPFRDCSGAILPGERELIVGPCSADNGEEETEENMSYNGPCPPLKIEGGKLYWWTCCEWLEIGSLTPPTAVHDEPYDGWPGEPEFYACGKAFAVVSLLYEVAGAVWDERDALDLWNVMGRIKAAVPGVDLTNSYLWAAIGEAKAAAALGYSTGEVISATDKQTIICRSESLFSADDPAMTTEQFNALAVIIGVTLEAAVSAMMVTCMYAIGLGDLSNAAIAGASTNQDCDCPTEAYIPEVPEGMDWTYYADLETAADMPDWLALLDGTSLESGKGARHYSAVSGLGNPTIEAVIHATGGVVKWAYLRYKIGAAAGEGDYEGVQVLDGTDLTSFIARADTGDTDPSAGGVFSVSKNLNYEIVGGDGSFTVKLEVRDEGAHTEDRTVTIQGVGFAGTGTNPALDAT